MAHLFLARALDRGRETALQIALGAGGLQLGRGFVAEGLIVTLAGGVSGLFLTFWAASALRAWRPVDFVPLRLEIAPDSSVFVFTFGLALVTALVLGAVPLRLSGRRDLTAALGGVQASGTRSRSRRFLLVAQIAVSLVLLAAALFFLESLRRATAIDPGFNSARILALDLDLELAGFDEEEGRRFWRDATRHLGSRPGVRAVSLADLAPVDLATARRPISLDGASAGGESGKGEPRVSSNVVAADYFELLDIPLRSGRVFTEADQRAVRDELIVVINRTMASRLWSDRDPLGERFWLLEESRQARIVGVVEDVKYRTFGEEPTPHFYLLSSDEHQPAMTLLIKTEASPMSFLGEAQRELTRLDPRVRGFFARTLAEHLAFALLPARVAAVLFGLFGVTALLLATVGIYGAVSHSVARRRRELGIRAALGATMND